MRKILKILILVLFFTSGCQTGGYFFGRKESIEVAKGDTLYGISRKYDIPLQTLAEMNNLSPPYSLAAGQTIILSVHKNTPNEAGRTFHKISKGDTLYSIAKKYNVPLRNLIGTNSLTPPYSLVVGQNLQIPSNQYHTVTKGDTIYNISKRYNVDVTSLSRINNLKAPYTISVGDKLVLPGTIGSNNTSAKKADTRSFFGIKIRNAPKKTTTTSRTTQKVQTAKKTRAVTARTRTAYIKPVSTNRTAKFAWPVKGPIISNYGTIGKGRKNDGINIKAPLGASVNAADKGVVVYAGNELKGFGNLILIKHPDGWITAYAHNDKIFVRKGQSVRKGEKVSSVGRTGGVNAPQLHFEIHVNKKPINPMPYLQ
ncbi:MAG: LysM peptidoglycan-binding domain-containing protein [Lactobacillaceae bacterium]|jgi:murein DD-endopeptidase MepM/ murein hydrolase activator NlpD|nr:LysM peptidoglycan-binding domain-containing protein [Lactobacillaceae bacterium]